MKCLYVIINVFIFIMVQNMYLATYLLTLFKKNNLELNKVILWNTNCTKCNLNFFFLVIATITDPIIILYYCKQ